MIPDVATDIIVHIIKNIIDNIGKTDENKNIYSHRAGSQLKSIAIFGY